MFPPNLDPGSLLRSARLHLVSLILLAPGVSPIHAQFDPTCDLATLAEAGLDGLLFGTNTVNTQLNVRHRTENAAGVDACYQCTASVGLDVAACEACTLWATTESAFELPTARAEEARDALVGGSNSMTALGFPGPHSDKLPLLETLIFPFKKEGVVIDGELVLPVAFALSSCINVDVAHARTSHGVGQGLEQTLHHEVFHMVQRNFMTGIAAASALPDNPTNPSRMGAWVSEGQASLVPERLSLLADWLAQSSFRARVDDYLREHSHVPLTELNYRAALFWSYACEQLGNGQGNPAQGVDLLQTFWKKAQERGSFDSLGAIEEVLEEKGRGRLASFFHELAIALYTHDRPAPGPGIPLPERFRFVDEADPTVTNPTLFNGTAMDPPLPYAGVGRRCYCVQGNGCPPTGPFSSTCVGISLPWHGGQDSDFRDACEQSRSAALLECQACVKSEDEDVEACDACKAWKAVCAKGEQFYVKALAAEHVELDLSPLGPKPCTALDLRLRAQESVFWSLVAMDSNGAPQRLWSSEGPLFARTLLNPAELGFERLALIVSGRGLDTPFEVWIDEVEPTLSVLSPTSFQPARPGPADNPGSFLVRVAVSGTLPVPEPESWTASLGPSAAVGGLRREDFEIALTESSGTTAVAQVLSSTFLGGEYVLLVNAPANLQNRGYDLRVKLVGSDCEATVAIVEDGAQFGTDPAYHVLALDGSASMDSPAGTSRLAAAQGAAKLYIDGVGSNDRVGIVVFRGDDADCSDNSTVALGLTEALPGVRGAQGTAAVAIDGITASGTTSIGDGVFRARRMLVQSARRGEPKELVVLSDGGENEGRFLFTPTPCAGSDSLAPATDAWSETGISVNAITIGPGSDEARLAQLARMSAEPRLSWYVDAHTSSGAGGGGASSVGLSLANRMADVFLRSLERSTRRDRVVFRTQNVRANTPATVSLEVAVADGAEDGVFFIHWDPPGAMALTLRNPSGKVITATDADRYDGDAHVVFHLRGRSPLSPGRWTVEVSSFLDRELMAGCQARDPERVVTELDVAAGPGLPAADPGARDFTQGLPVTLLARLSDRKGRIQGASVIVSIETPGGPALGGQCEGLQLLDDGAHNDGDAGDGVYGLVFRQTRWASEGAVDQDGVEVPEEEARRGSYIVSGTARGRTNLGTDFDRPVELHFHVKPSEKDTDGDGMIDVWEKHHGTAWDIPDGNEDPDRDGLFNRNEYLNGTHPLSGDTDGNGELDASELRRARCPIDPADDAIATPLDVEVVLSDYDVLPSHLQEGAILLRFPVFQGQAGLRIFRAEDNAANPYVLLETLTGTKLANALHHDVDVVPNRVYFYKFQAIGVDGAESAVSRVVRGSLPGQPGPSFDAVLENGATFTDDLVITATIQASASARHFRISSRPLTGNEALREMTDQPVQLRISEPPTRRSMVPVFLELHDGDGRPSGVWTRSLLFDPDGDFDGDGIPNRRDRDDDQDGLDDVDELERTGTNPARADTDGDGDSDGVDPAPLLPGVRRIAGSRHFVRGDVNADGRRDLSDAIGVLSYLFLGTEQPGCQKSADADDSGRIDITDAVAILDFLFLGGRPPPPPTGQCGVDPTADLLGCEDHRPCGA